MYPMCWETDSGRSCMPANRGMITDAMERQFLVLTLELEPGRSRTVSGEDSDPLAQLYRAHQELLWRLAARMTGDPASAEDLLQETFLRAALHRSRLPQAERSARAWLTQTLVNLCRDGFRRAAVRRRHQEEAGSGRTEAVQADPERLAAARQLMNAALNRLSARRRAVLVLRDLEGLTETRVAELLGIRAPTVRWHLAAARSQLRRRLEGRR